MKKVEDASETKNEDKKLNKVEDCSIRYLPDVLAIIKDIMDHNLEKEFISECKDKQYFVVATDTTRQFVHDFMIKHGLTPEKQNLHGLWTYGKRCS